MGSVTAVGHAPGVSSCLPVSSEPDERPQIYLAGPYTQHLVFTEASVGPSADLVQPPGGLIGPESAWRQILLATSQALEHLGWSVFLPHRDVSAWGERAISPGTVARECLEAVVGSDVVLAVMGESFGTHVEVGAALAAGIPAVVIRSSSSSESYFASGVAESSWVGELSLEALEQLPHAVGRNIFGLAIRQAQEARMSPGRKAAS
jgi:hypothetical protein